MYTMNKTCKCRSLHLSDTGRGVCSDEEDGVVEVEVPPRP